MPLTDFAFDRFVAQRMSQLTECRAAPVRPEFPEAAFWVSHFALNWMLGAHVGDEHAPAGIALIRWALSAMRSFDAGVAALSTIPRRNADAYFDCLDHFEATVITVARASERLHKLWGEKPYVKNGGSPDERLAQLCNILKHSDLAKLPPGHLHAVWLENDGLHGAEINGRGTLSVRLGYDELRAMVVLLCRVAHKVANNDRTCADGSPLPPRPE